jgi:hypothetical protein
MNPDFRGYKKHDPRGSLPVRRAQRCALPAGEAPHRSSVSQDSGFTRSQFSEQQRAGNDVPDFGLYFWNMLEIGPPA